MTAAVFPTLRLPAHDVTVATRVALVGQHRVRPPHSVYVRRRLLVLMVTVVVLTALALLASNVSADRGDVPASIPAVRPAIFAASLPVAAVVPAPTTYVVRSGDTLWALAEAHHGDSSIASYVDRLMALNGGTSLQVGQLIVLP